MRDTAAAQSLALRAQVQVSPQRKTPEGHLK